MISDNAKIIFDLLPDDGEALTGNQIKEQIEFGAESFKNAKKELKEAGCVTLGRGRGGSVKKIVGAELPKAAPKLSRSELMAAAREEKVAKSKQQKQIDETKKLVEDIVSKELNIETERIKVFPKFPHMTSATVEVWDEEQKTAQIYAWKES